MEELWLLAQTLNRDAKDLIVHPRTNSDAEMIIDLKRFLRLRAKLRSVIVERDIAATHQSAD